MNSLEQGKEIFKNKSKLCSNSPGVYQVFDEKNKIIYVGKAKNLPNRLSNYSSSSTQPIRTERMIASTNRIDTISTLNESEALLLEANLIKKNKPRYNVLLKDDKSFPYIQIRSSHDYPQITKFRGKHNDKDIYFGPFASIASANWTIKMLQKVFQIRVCDDNTFKGRSRPCILYQIKRCSGPCTGEITKSEYSKTVDECSSFLNGKSRDIQKKMSQEMEKESDRLNFEKAAILRDRIKSLTYIQSSQNIQKNNLKDADLIVSYRKENITCVVIFFYRSKQNWGSQYFYPKHDHEDSDEHILKSFLTQFYENKEPPSELVLNLTPENHELIKSAFEKKYNKKISIKISPKNSMVKNAVKNAQEQLQIKILSQEKNNDLLISMGEKFKLGFTPSLIEVYDNSHNQGDSNIGALIAFGKDGFIKNRYRKFNIKNTKIKSNDDYGMMTEVIQRRFSKVDSLTDENVPDLLLIDGGKGQYSVVRNKLNDLGFHGLKIIAISKGKERNKGNEKFISEDGVIELDKNDPVLFLTQRIRDEAHRFAITIHRKKKTKQMFKSPLDEIDGIGSKRKKALLSHFGSAKAIEGASLDDIKSIDGINDSSAEKVYNFFHKKKNIL
jgi:excinuclease ABC subunit C